MQIVLLDNAPFVFKLVGLGEKGWGFSRHDDVPVSNGNRKRSEFIEGGQGTRRDERNVD